MKRTIILATIMLSAALSMQAYASTASEGPAAKATPIAVQHSKKAPVHRRVAQSSDHAVTYNRDSKDPNIGWHNEGGMRVCRNDCDNPEIPGSGYTCRDVNVLGMAMRECDWSSW